MKVNQILRYSFLLVVLLGFASCQRKAKVNAEKPEISSETTHFKGATSTINIPIILTIPELEKTANQVVTGIIYKDESYTNNDNDDLKLVVKKSKEITISANKNELYFDVPLNIWAKLRKQILGVELSEDTEFETVMKFKTSLDVTSDWNFKTKTTSLGYRIVKEPTIKLGPLEIPITSLVKSALDDQLDGITKILDEQVQKQLNLRQIVQDHWELIQKPVLLDKEYRTWLRVQPQQFTISPIQGNKQQVSFNIGVSSVIDVFSGDEPSYTINKKIPSLVINENPEEKFHISLASELSYDQANQLIKDNLVGFKYQYKKKEIEVADAKVFGNGDKLVMEATFIGDVEGTLYFTGKPAYDSVTNSMFIDDLDFDVKSKKAVLKVANWLLKGTFKKKMTQHMRIGLQEEIDKVTDLVKESLQENSVSNNVKIDLHIDKVVPKGMFVADEMLRILIEIDGHTIVKYGE